MNVFNHLSIIKFLLDINGSFMKNSHCNAKNLISVNELNANFRAQNDFNVPAVTKTKREKTRDLYSITFRHIHHSFQSYVS